MKHFKNTVVSKPHFNLINEMYPYSYSRSSYSSQCSTYVLLVAFPLTSYFS